MNPANAHAAALSYLSRRLVDKKLDKAQFERLADAVLNENSRVIAIDPCIYGICIDHYFPKFDDIRIKDIIALSPGKVRNIDILIDGIINPDIIRVRVGQEVF